MWVCFCILCGQHRFRWCCWWRFCILCGQHRFRWCCWLRCVYYVVNIDLDDVVGYGFVYYVVNIDLDDVVGYGFVLCLIVFFLLITIPFLCDKMWCTFLPLSDIEKEKTSLSLVLRTNAIILYIRLCQMCLCINKESKLTRDNSFYVYKDLFIVCECICGYKSQ